MAVTASGVKVTCLVCNQAYDAMEEGLVFFGHFAYSDVFFAKCRHCIYHKRINQMYNENCHPPRSLGIKASVMDKLFTRELEKKREEEPRAE